MQTSPIRCIPAILCFLILTFTLPAQDYQKAWEHINKNERSEAFKIIEPGIRNSSATIDEFITYYYLKLFDGQESEIIDFVKHVRKSDNPDAYIYALWFSSPVAGEYGYKRPHQLALLKELVTASPGNGTLRASAHYNLGHHYTRTHQFSLIKNENEKIGALSDWQFTGPFNNVSGSGFNKNYEPIADASNESVFRSASNAPIQWFTPVEKSTEGWVYTGYFISENSEGITFAQTFVQSETDQDVYLCAGSAGNIKVWVNDQQIISVPEERITEMDTYNSKCHLNAGYNRILVQAGGDDYQPNFIIRLTDANYAPLTNIKSIATPQKYSKINGTSSSKLLPHFAETYFSDKIRQNPDDILNYILLSEVYLRNQKLFEARNTIENAIALAPDNSLLKFKLIYCYLKDDNRTGLTELYEYFLEHEPESLISYTFRIEEMKRQEKYQEALDLIEQQIKLYGSDESTYDDLIQVYANLNKVPEMVQHITEAYQKYPDNDVFVKYIFTLEQKFNKNPKRALNILEDYLSNHYDYGLSELLIQEYFNTQNLSKPFRIIEEQIQAWPFNPTIRLDLLREYLEQQRYHEAYEVSEFMLKMKPYSGYYYDNKATIEESLGKEADAIKSYHKALEYQPTLYESRDKLFRLEKKKSLFDYVEGESVETLISKSGKNFKSEDYDFYLIQHETNVVMYPEGGREELHISAIKILNQRGIDQFKEFSLPYNSNAETILIEEAQIIKPNGKKTKPEISDNQIVWTGLEANDVIYVKYKLRSYLTGKFAQEFYDNFIFEGFIPFEQAKYSVILPKSWELYSKVENGNLVPSITEEDDYKIYVWEKQSVTAIEEEPYMPSTTDFATTLHISTIEDWKEIAEWYSDLVYSKIANDSDYEVNAVYKEIFDGTANLTTDEKAKLIYDYIANNISYSSVSFRQSAIVPQKASKTIHTRLGDCKDISTLFVSLANLAGLKSNLVLVNTRDNGEKSMMLPSFLFNHCIVKYYDDQNAEHYLELTDRDLPFKSLPSDLYQAMTLTIPSRVNGVNNQTLTPLVSSNKTGDKVRTGIRIEVTGNDLQMISKTVKSGSLTSSIRNTFRSLSQDNINKQMQESLANTFTNPIRISNVVFEGLYDLSDSITMTTQLSVSNEVKKIGSFSAFSIPFTDVIFTAPPFNPEKRKLDFEYWNYENADMYETNVEILLPEGKTFVELPQNENFSFKDITYSISYTQSMPNKLVVARKAVINRNNISPADYVEFKSFVTRILNAEGSYITFK